MNRVMMFRRLVVTSKQVDLFKRSIVAARFKRFSTNTSNYNQPESEDLTPKISIPNHADVVIIGGGAMGSSIAYWLKKKICEHFKVVVIEKDPTYCKASTTLSVGGLRQQFSLEENIQMSLFGAEFLRNIDRHLGIENQSPVDVCFRPHGYLLLASEAGAEILIRNSNLQNSMGAKNILLKPEKLKDMFPWINVEGIALGCLGLEKEGWFDPWALLCAFKKKAINLGVEYVHAEAKAFEFDVEEFEDPYEPGYRKLNLRNLKIETPDGERCSIAFAKAVIAAGAFSQKVARMAMVGVGEGLLKTPLPVEPRKRFVYCFHCPDGPGLNTPLTIDPTGTYFRREGLAGAYICGRSPEECEEPLTEDLDVDHEYFEDKIWPVLAGRVPAFEKLKVNSAWAGYYEYNTFDANGIVGEHPKLDNLIFATGFSGHGIQHSPAVGRAVAELLLNYKYQTIDLSRLGFGRLLDNEPLREVNVI